jgi:hypothetical protein
MLDGAIGANTILFDKMPQFRFKFTKNDIQKVFSRPLYLELIASAAFLRLQDIRFLGAIDYLIHPNGKKSYQRHTRFTHSLCVAELAIRGCELMELTEEETIHAVVAALLHDIGHAPLSHSLEPVLERQFGISHHDAGRMLLLGVAPIGKQLSTILKNYNINVDRVISLIAGVSNEPSGVFFSGPLNIDTIEAISRTYSYASCNAVEPAPIVVLDAAIRREKRDIEVLDQFWRLKDHVYNYIINGRAGLLADAVSRWYVEKNIADFNKDFYFCDERYAKRYHKGLFLLLRYLRNPTYLRKFLDSEAGSATITLKSRSFTVDHSVAAPEFRNDPRRYLQTKKYSTLHLNEIVPKLFESNAPWYQLDNEIDHDSNLPEH